MTFLCIGHQDNVKYLKYQQDGFLQYQMCMTEKEKLWYICYLAQREVILANIIRW